MIANDPLLQAFLDQTATTTTSHQPPPQSQPLPHDLLLDQFDLLPLLPTPIATAATSAVAVASGVPVSVGLGTPPMSPPARSFSHSYKQLDQWMDNNNTHPANISYSEPMALFHPPQQQQSLPHPSQQQSSFTSHINTSSSASSKLLTHLYQQQPQRQHQNYSHQQQQQQQQMADSVFGTSPTSNYSSSPVSTTVDADFELYPMSNAGASSALLIPSYASDSPSTTTAVTTTAPTTGYGGQMTPPTPVMNDMVGLAAAAAAVSASNVAPVSTADMSMLCHCPGVYPCIPKSTKPLSPFVSAFEPEEDLLYEEQQQQPQQQQQQPPSVDHQQHGQEDGTSDHYGAYDNGYHHHHNHHHHHDHSASPYASPYTKDHSTSPTSSTTSSSSGKPLRADRRRSSTYSSTSSSTSTGGKAERTPHPLLDPSQVPEITDIHVCPVCQRRFTRPFNLRSHLMTHTTARPYPCDQCHWKFTRQHDLQRHKRAKHPNSVTSPAAPAQENKSLKAV
ncbi:hypothetical protein BGZ73_005009 [Actinomortierella ambigua]|nr:hypothetical protein BGZ73_005009 [Actinomortierella ambigua]